MACRALVSRFKESRPTLQKLAALLRSSHDSDLSLVITGHTDARGSNAYNDALSERRAHTVAEWLERNHVVERGRVRAAGRGSRDPVDAHADAKNRRVEVQVSCP